MPDEPKPTKWLNPNSPEFLEESRRVQDEWLKERAKEDVVAAAEAAQKRLITGGEAAAVKVRASLSEQAETKVCHGRRLSSVPSIRTLYRRKALERERRIIEQAESEVMRFTLLIQEGKTPEEAGRLCAMLPEATKKLWEELKLATGAFSPRNLAFFRSVAAGDMPSPIELLRLAHLTFQHVMMDPDAKDELRVSVATTVVNTCNKPGMTPYEAAQADETSIDLAKQILGKSPIVKNESVEEN